MGYDRKRGLTQTNKKKKKQQNPEGPPSGNNSNELTKVTPFGIPNGSLSESTQKGTRGQGKPKTGKAQRTKTQQKLKRKTKQNERGAVSRSPPGSKSNQIKLIFILLNMNAIIRFSAAATPDSHFDGLSAVAKQGKQFVSRDERQ